MTEKLSEFRQRVGLLQKAKLWRYGQAVWNAMEHCPPKEGQRAWCRYLRETQGIGEIQNDPFHDDSKVDAFIADAIAAGVLVDDTAQERKAEASLGVQTVPQVPLLRWVEQDDGGAKLTLGDVSIAEVYTPIDDADAVWYAESEHRIAPRNSDFPDRAAAMRAVEAAFGITAPLPVEVQP